MMTNAPSQGAPTTYELYAGAALYADSVDIDLGRYLHETCGVDGWSEAKRRSRCREKIGDVGTVDVCLRLYDASRDRAGDEAAFLRELIKAQGECDRLRGLARNGDFAAEDLRIRLALYRVELGDHTALPDAREHATAHAREAVLGDPTVLLALGLTLAHPQAHVWRANEGRVREAMIRQARELVVHSPEKSKLKARAYLAEIAATVTAEDDAADYERGGIVRVGKPPATPTRVVLRSVSHLPGMARDGSEMRSSAHSPRSEFAHLAGRPLPLVCEQDVAMAAAELRDEWPWARTVIDTLLLDLVGRPHVQIRPTLLLGPPGAGKTRLARRIADALHLDATVYPCAGVADAAFGGTSRQWSTGRACVPLQAVRRSLIANPLIVLDEIEKAGTRAENGRLVDSLIPLLEGESAARFFDPYVECEVDLSCVSYIATANSLSGIPEPLLDRLRVVQVPEPGPERLGEIVRRILDELRDQRRTDETWLPDLDPDELDLLAQAWPGGSLRVLRRLVETVVAGREALAIRH